MADESQPGDLELEEGIVISSIAFDAKALTVRLARIDWNRREMVHVRTIVRPRQSWPSERSQG